MPSPEELAPHFPQLAIIRCLGRGGMGVVYEARQKSLDRRVALKLLAPARDQNAAFTERFLREARALARLNHPNIVTVHDYGESGGLHYLLMEFVDGVNLRQLLAAGHLAPEQALAIVPPICEALEYAHGQGIIHRDIKPENLLVDKQGRVKIADFGIARLLDRGESDSPLTEAALGTPDYMAPEQRQHPNAVDARADIFSLGVVFYEMLTGDRPSGNFLPPSRRVQVDVRLDEIVLRALEQEPQRRFQSAADLKTQVEAVRTSPNPEEKALAPGRMVDQIQRVGLRRWARLGFALMLAGTLGTLVLMILSPRHELALTFAGLALLLALILGIKSWSDRLGRTVAVVTLVLFASAGLTVLVLTEAVPIGRWMRRRASATVEPQLRADQRPMSGLAEVDSKKRAFGGKLRVRVLADGSGEYPTVQAALDAVPDYAVVELGPGRFSEQVILRRPVRLLGQGWDKTILGPTNLWVSPGGTNASSGMEAAVSVRGGGALLSGMRITRPGTIDPEKLSSQGIVEVENAELQMVECAVVGGAGNGVVFSPGSRGQLQRCLVAAVWNTGIVAAEGSRVTIQECDIRNCYYAGVVLRRGVWVAALWTNRISGAAWHGIRYDDSSPTILGNLIFANARSGIYASGTTRALVNGNVFFGNEMDGVSCWFNSSDLITGNTFVSNKREALSMLGRSSPTVSSNIFAIHPVALRQGVVGGTRDGAGSLGNPAVEHNLFWKNGTNWIRWGPADGAEPRQMALDDSNAENDPGFVNPGAREFSRRSDSAATYPGIGVARPISSASPWPLQPEELAIIPASDTRDWRQWKRPGGP
ncbi:MAG: protein kinase [Verrucomicrobia bacterium]|nr:protein kinase [Verrucomicrobiota bacterium]